MTAARKLPVEAKQAPRPSTRELFTDGLKRMDVPSLMEAEREYGDDFERELADIEAGRHPVQRRKRAR